jgi:hypothetical protein
VKKPSTSPLPKDRELANHIASDRDQEEQVRELAELQRSLAERIRKIERAADKGQEDETA